MSSSALSSPISSPTLPPLPPLPVTLSFQLPPPYGILGYSNAEGYTNSLKDASLIFNYELYVRPEVPIYTQFIGQ
jgi:hypothetical protein